MKRDEKTVFLDGVDWQHEVEGNKKGTKIYPGMKDLKKHHEEAGCGVVRCKLIFDGWVIQQDMEIMKKTSIPASELTKIQIEDTKKEIAKLQAFLAKLETVN